MNESTFRKLEYDKIKKMTVDLTVSDAGKRLAEGMKPSLSKAQIEAWQTETFEASELLGSGASIPLSAMEGIEAFLVLLGKGRSYTEQELEALSVWLASVAQMKRYMRGKMQIAPTIATYAESLDDCKQLREELGRCIRYGRLTDEASSDLAYVRRHIYSTEDKISRKMEHSLSKYRSSLQENIVSKRRDRFVLAVKRELRKQVPGNVLDESASGQTLFIEPADISELQQELAEWRAAEERERTVVLSQLSQLAEGYAYALETNAQAMASFDFIMARGKLARSYEGRRVTLSDQPVIWLKGARHPLLGTGSMPLDAELGIRWKQLIITGPNTGGKTVSLKTIGLLVLMAQSGLLIPAEEGSVLGILRHVLADVGDGQSLEQSLSTFSSHIAVLKEMFDVADTRSLLLLDEMAAGTDPSEGIALSIAVLEMLLERGSLVGATTHFNEIKSFAARTPGCQNGRMAFDPGTLKPLYRLEIGEAGDSHAFAIARRFGLPEAVMLRAERLLTGKKEQAIDFNAEKDGLVWEGANDQAEFDEQPYASKPTSYNVDRPLGAGKPSAIPSFSKPPVLTEQVESASHSPLITPKRVFQKGDSVWIYPLKRAGVVYRSADEKGNVIVQVKGEKLSFNHKRLKMYIAKEKLYPGESYDLDIVFESKEHRKVRHEMGRKHVEGLEIILPPE
ncbi:DNA mismatch repair protein MutS [Paenibacillus sp. 1011MAR3C5]|uniref:endonuclease MutS2 n=1 Tax=Paenibacillus sp. 1011MAR3C5 TaxID=1675787 RepID=UPI000E6C604B|nr:DNA mismatch repair protein MutS [Paenibacillus sp. 1011MAR3C5]RJE90188.1 DNA mismatch repair protein MutS [Paenibacillus sp. 1011MAR3C5]